MRASSCSAVLQCTSAFHPSGAQHSAFCCTGHQECSTPAADFYTASLMIRHMPLEQPAASCHPVHQHQQQCHTCGSNMNTPRQHSSFILTDIIELAACPICMRQASTTHCASVCNCRHLVSQPLHLSRTMAPAVLHPHHAANDTAAEQSFHKLHTLRAAALAAPATTQSLEPYACTRRTPPPDHQTPLTNRRHQTQKESLMNRQGQASLTEQALPSGRNWHLYAATRALEGSAHVARQRAATLLVQRRPLNKQTI